ncbi:hypothetical protein NDU88_005196 [Pleurodeles waltl]|uniref:Uncharacterized protein n=1 Tax=Pleurodeles waltl TaxID=8319 RepID=A0AAV7TU26_PLEWA|nr:hypothetical protein NDU88_005196 [Pleurodeles waltl]
MKLFSSRTKEGHKDPAICDGCDAPDSCRASELELVRTDAIGVAGKVVLYWSPFETLEETFRWFCLLESGFCLLIAGVKLFNLLAIKALPAVGVLDEVASVLHRQLPLPL